DIKQTYGRNGPVLQYLGMINLQECDTNSIMRDIKIFLSAKVSNLYQTLNSIITALQTDIVVDKDGSELAKKLLEELDPNFILMTKFLEDLFNILQLIKAF
ncbi:1858_t:CDS:2, partial [Funneliformis geosporum]